MWLHLGQSTVVNSSAVIGIFDLDNCTVSRHTRELLRRAQQEDRVINVTMELPKSFIVCLEKGEEILYLSQISPRVLLKRLGNIQSQNTAV